MKSGVSVDRPEALGVHRSEMSSHLWAATSLLGRLDAVPVQVVEHDHVNLLTSVGPR